MVRQKLRKLRKDRGISQSFISKALGYKHPSGYANIEMGRTDLSLAQSKTIAEILGCSIDDLAEEENGVFFQPDLHEIAKNKSA